MLVTELVAENLSKLTKSFKKDKNVSRSHKGNNCFHVITLYS